MDSSAGGSATARVGGVGVVGSTLGDVGWSGARRVVRCSDERRLETGDCRGHPSDSAAEHRRMAARDGSRSAAGSLIRQRRIGGGGREDVAARTGSAGAARSLSRRSSGDRASARKSRGQQRARHSGGGSPDGDWFVAARVAASDRSDRTPIGESSAVSQTMESGGRQSSKSVVNPIHFSSLLADPDSDFQYRPHRPRVGGTMIGH